MTSGNVDELFGPRECWCTQHGQVWYPCKRTKLCKETNEKYKQKKERYLNSKQFIKDQEREQKRIMKFRATRRARKREGYNIRRRQKRLDEKKLKSKKKKVSFFGIF